ncbi:MAG: hypothetical protein HQL56_09275 [Magnetococcales bacterium]|nr:hypothetical protein [Magnetococcales bacterium]
MEEMTAFEEPTRRLAAIVEGLHHLPVVGHEGFLNVGNQMGTFSGGFATSASRATSIKERIATGGELGLTTFKTDFRKIQKEIEGVFAATTSMMAYHEAFLQRLGNILNWSQQLQKETFLPPLVEQLRIGGGRKVERQTLCAMIDNLVLQVRPLLDEVVSSTQTAGDQMHHLTRRIRVELDASQHTTVAIQESVTETLKNMSRLVRQVDGVCVKMESHSDDVNRAVFAMVQDMQMDDITSQRIHHALTAVEKIDEKLEGGSGKKKAVRWAIVAARIVMRQLMESRDSLVTAVESIRGHLDSIAQTSARQTDDVVEAWQTSMQFHHDITDVSYQLGALVRLGIFEETLPTDILRALTQSENALFQAKRAMDMLVMTGHRLEKLSSSLSTEGLPRLSTVNNRIITLARNLQTQCAEKLPEFDEANNQLQEFSAVFAEKVTPRLMRTSSLLRRAPLTTQQLDINNADLVRIMKEILQETRQIAGQVELLQADLTFHHQVGDQVEKLLKQFQDLLGIIGVGLGEYLEGDLSQLAAEFEDLVSLYTMASERNAHLAALGGEGGADSGEDDIELF